MQYLRINVMREVKELSAEICNTLTKNLRAQKQIEKYPMFVDLKN